MTYPTEHSPNTIYTEGEQFAGLTGRRRKQLMLLHRAFHGPFDAPRAASVLDLDIKRTRRLLAALADSGWLAQGKRKVARDGRIGPMLGVVCDRQVGIRPWILASALP